MNSSIESKVATPRTDAVAKWQEHVTVDDYNGMVDLARQLERELSEATLRIKIWTWLERRTAQEKKDAARYRWLKERYEGVDFDYDGASMLLFEIHRNARVGAHLDATIDEEMAKSVALIDTTKETK